MEKYIKSGGQYFRVRPPEEIGFAMKTNRQMQEMLDELNNRLATAKNMEKPDQKAIQALGKKIKKVQEEIDKPIRKTLDKEAGDEERLAA